MVMPPLPKKEEGGGCVVVHPPPWLKWVLRLGMAVKMSVLMECRWGLRVMIR